MKPCCCISGHSSAVRDIYIPNNEHYFLSASRDKTVKFWRLKNHGNGTAQIGCGKTYDKHSKPVFAVQSIESKRFAVSCDGTVHVRISHYFRCEVWRVFYLHCVRIKQREQREPRDVAP